MLNFTKTEAGRDLAPNMQSLKRVGKSDEIVDVIEFLAPDGPMHLDTPESINLQVGHAE